METLLEFGECLVMTLFWLWSRLLAMFSFWLQNFGSFNQNNSPNLSQISNKTFFLNLVAKSCKCLYPAHLDKQYWTKVNENLFLLIKLLSDAKSQDLNKVNLIADRAALNWQRCGCPSVIIHHSWSMFCSEMLQAHNILVGTSEGCVTPFLAINY